MSAQVCSPGLALAPALTRSVPQATLGCPGPSPAQAGARTPAPQTLSLHSPSSLHVSSSGGGQAHQIRARVPEGSRLLPAHTAWAGAWTPGTPWMGEEVVSGPIHRSSFQEQQHGFGNRLRGWNPLLPSVPVASSEEQSFLCLWRKPQVSQTPLELTHLGCHLVY